jgi:hypothetical protein
MNTVQTLKSKDLETMDVNWAKVSGRFVVSISTKLEAVSKVEKSWEFDPSSISEAVSFYWYEYVVREIQQHIQSGGAGVPQILMSANDSDAGEMIQMVLQHL